MVRSGSRAAKLGERHKSERWHEVACELISDRRIGSGSPTSFHVLATDLRCQSRPQPCARTFRNHDLHQIIFWETAYARRTRIEPSRIPEVVSGIAASSSDHGAESVCEICSSI